MPARRTPPTLRLRIRRLLVDGALTIKAQAEADALVTGCAVLGYRATWTASEGKFTVRLDNRPQNFVTGSVAK